MEKESAKRKKDQFTVVLEDINSKMDIMVEGQKIFKEEVNNRFDNLENKFDNLENRFDNLENRFDNLETRFDNLENRFDELEQKVDTGFEKSFEYMSRIEEELTGKLESKIGNEEYQQLEQRVESLEEVCVREK